MARAVSIEVREMIVRLRSEDGDLTYEDIARIVGRGPATVSRVLTKARRGESLAAKPRGGARVVKVDEAGRAWVAERVDREPDITLEKLADEYHDRFGVRVVPTTMGNALRRLGYTLKKRPFERAKRTQTG